MFYTIFHGLLFLSFSYVEASKNPVIAFQYLTDDSVGLDIYEYYDAAGLLDGYTAHVNTPVCEDSLCYKAELEFYWNITGNFAEFKLMPDRPLTKLDHVPFSKSDYGKLMDILLNQTPSFVYLKRNELVSKNTDENALEIDGISSATVTQVKEDMVEGAIYTCYTLWHIANGEIIFNIKEHTIKKLDKPLIHKLLGSKNLEELFFVIENIDSGYFSIFLPEILSLAEEYGGYFIKSVIENMPVSLMKDDIVQNFFSTNFNQLEHQAQNSLLEKLEEVRLKKSILVVLIDGILPGNSLQNEQIIRMVIKNTNSENIEVLIKMFEVLRNRQIVVSEDLYKELISLEDRYESLKKEVRRFRNIHDKRH